MRATKPFTVFLADLFHDQVAIHDVVPLNIAYLANALRVTYGEAVEFRLFKYASKLLEALESTKPDVLALSNYTWNEQLSLKFARIAKKHYPELLTVMGGPNIRHEPEGMRDYLGPHPEIDIYIPLAAEFPFVNLIGLLLEMDGPSSVQALGSSIGSVPGIYLNTPSYEFTPFDISLYKDSFRFGSPYLNGLLDEFISDPNLVPLFETNRGCPYSCTFCVWGISALSKVYTKELDTIRQEFRYVAQNGAGQKYWFFADANFGILPRDLEIAHMLRECHDEYGVPVKLNVNWAKSASSDRVVAMIKSIGSMAEAQIATQSFDHEVLAKIKRKNLKDSAIRQLVDMYHAADAKVFTDILVGLSGESMKSHQQTLRRVFEYDYDFMNIGTIRMLPGSEMESDADRSKYGFMTKFRLTANSYGYYDGEFVFEIEEGICGSNTLSLDEMVELRVSHFLIYALWSSGIARNLLKLGMTFGVSPIDHIVHLQGAFVNEMMRSVLEDLRSELKSEWFDSVDQLRTFYSNPDIHKQLMGEKAQSKLMWKYLARLLNSSALMAEVLSEICQHLLNSDQIDRDMVETVRLISIDSMRLDFESDSDLIKTREYTIARSHFEFLAGKGLLPKGVEYADSGFRVRYSYSQEEHAYFKGLLERFHYKHLPINAIYSVLHYGLISNLCYSVSGLSSDREDVQVAGDLDRVDSAIALHSS